MKKEVVRGSLRKAILRAASEGSEECDDLVHA